MPESPAGQDTIRILVATDNHVGFNERDAVRGDDSEKSFDEIMCLAKEKTVDMVLLAGDLFHENNPSRKALNAVMRSIRNNCYGDKPCELEMLSDPTEHFDATFDHVNYEDPDINVAIPIFSIHGNHDDPSGVGHLAPLDLLQTSGLINYYGRTPESDNITIKPILLQKGRSKLALYGMSNVRDERLYRTFRDHKVRFYRPNVQGGDWFNLCSVHQNHVQHTKTADDYLPEDWLPKFLDLVVWGHEHECLIEPRTNPTTGFKVMQPGSSVATSLMPGEAVDKYVAILEITGKDFTCTPISLKTVRPFVMREIALQDDPAMAALAMRPNNQKRVTNYLTGIVEEMIEEAKQKWYDQKEDLDEASDVKPPLPLIRLRVNYSAPEGGNFEVENTQRFSNRWANRVANIRDVVQFHKKKRVLLRNKGNVDMPDESTLDQMNFDSVKVEKLVREFLTAQQLTILPPRFFGDAVAQFVDKDDKYAMESFVGTSLGKQMANLMERSAANEEDASKEMDEYRSKMDDLYASGRLKNVRRTKIKPKPTHWDSDLDGHWEDQPAAVVIESDQEGGNGDQGANGDGDRERSVAPVSAARSRRQKSTAATSKTAAQKPAPKRTAQAGRGRGRNQVVEDEDDNDEEDDVIMIDDNDDDDDDVAEQERREERPQPSRKPPPKPPVSKRSSGRVTTSKAPKSSSRQTQLNFSQLGTQSRASKQQSSRQAREISDDEIMDDDEDDAFEPAPSSMTRGRTRR